MPYGYKVESTCPSLVDCWPIMKEEKGSDKICNGIFEIKKQIIIPV
jgi:hypothetical protein